MRVKIAGDHAGPETEHVNPSVGLMDIVVDKEQNGQREVVQELKEEQVFMLVLNWDQVSTFIERNSQVGFKFCEHKLNSLNHF